MKILLTFITGLVAGTVVMASATPATADGPDCESTPIVRSFIENRGFNSVR